MQTLEKLKMVRGPVRYRNPFRWRIMPPDHAAEQGFYGRSFENKKKALAYQKKVMAKFPDQPCPLIDSGRYFDSLGHIIH